MHMYLWRRSEIAEPPEPPNWDYPTCISLGHRISNPTRTPSLGGDIFAEYDYLLVFDKQVEKALYALSERVCDTWNSILRRGELKGWPNLPRICRLEGIDDQRDSWKATDPLYKKHVLPNVHDFAREVLGWEAPNAGTMNGGLRTSYVQIQPAAQLERIFRSEGKELKKIEQLTNCKSHSFWQSKGYGWAVAVVRPGGRLLGGRGIGEETKEWRRYRVMEKVESIS